MKRDRFPPLPPQDEDEDRRRMGAVVWVLVTLPAYVVLIVLGFKWLWGV